LKGVVFNLLEQVVSEEAGEAAWEQAISESGVDGALEHRDGLEDRGGDSE